MLLSLRHRLRVPEQGGAPDGRPREAVVLSGGGSLGAAQVGALRALLEAGVVPDLLVGCSVGALNAAFLALDPSAARVEELAGVWGQLERRHVFGSRSRVAAHLVRRDDHLYEPDALRALVRRWVPVADLAQTAVPCHVVTTDLLRGEPVWWTSGDPVDVLTASACLPAVFPPVALGGTLHVDGGVTCPVPVRRALELGAVRTWVVDCSGGSLGRRDARMSALDVLLLSFAISRGRLDAGPDGDEAQQVVRLTGLVTGRHDLRDFSQTERLLDGGFAAARPLVEAALAAVPAPRRAPDRVGSRSGSRWAEAGERGEVPGGATAPRRAARRSG